MAEMDPLSGQGQAPVQRPGSPAPQAQPSPAPSGPVVPQFGNPARYATGPGMDALRVLSQGYLIEGLYTAEAARQRVYRERQALQETHIRERDILAGLEQTFGLDIDDMSDERLESIMAVVSAPGLSVDEIFQAASQERQAEWASNFLASYNAGGILPEGPESRHTFLSQLYHNINRGSRQRRMWNALTPVEREFLVSTYGIKAPTIGRGLGFDEQSTGVLGFVDETATNIAYGLTVPVKLLIGAFEGAWRGSNRLYRGAKVLSDEQNAIQPAEQVPPSAVGEAFGAVIDTLGAGGDEYEERFGAQFGSLRELGQETLTWLQAVFSPWGKDNVSFRQRWEAGGQVGEETFLSSVVTQVSQDYGLDPGTADIVLGIAANMDSSLFGSPLHRVEQREGPNRNPLETLNPTTSGFGGNLTEMLIAYAGSEQVSADEAQQRELEALNANFTQALDQFLLDKIPGTEQEAAIQRAGARTMLLESQTIRLAAAELAMRGKVDFGRMTAMRLGNVPGTPEFQRAAGLNSIFNNFVLDPVIVMGKARGLSQIARGIQRADSIRSVERIQEIFDGVARVPGTNRTVAIPSLGRGFRRAVDDVGRAVVDEVNLALNNSETVIDLDLGRLNVVDEATDVVAEHSGLNRGFDRVARQQPRFAENFEQIRGYVWDRITEAREWGNQELLEVTANGQVRLRLGDDGQETVNQLVVDWMKQEEGLNALVNGRLGGIMTKHPTVPTDTLLGLIGKRSKRGAAIVLDKINDVPSLVARRIARTGAFDEHGIDIVKGTIDRLRVDGSIDADQAARLNRLVDESPRDRASDTLRAELGRVAEDKLRVIHNIADQGKRSGDLSQWLDLPIILRRLESDNPFGQMGLNATGVLSQPGLTQMLYASRVMKAGNVNLIRRVGLGLGAMVWAPVNFTNGLVRSFTILSPGRVLDYGSTNANTIIRNYASLMPSDVRARMVNMYAAGVTEADRVAVARNIMVESMEMMGLPYTSAGRRFMAKNLKIIDSANSQRFSAVMENNFISRSNGQRTAAAIRELDLAESMALPDFMKLQDLSNRLRWLDRVNPAAWPAELFTSKYMDWFMGKMWSPAVLFRLGFGFRTSVDELLAAVARDGVTGIIKGRIAQSSLSDKQLSPYLTRLDRFILRNFVVRPVASAPLARRMRLGGVTMETQMAQALDLPPEIIETLARSSSLRADDVEGLANARRALSRAISNSNPWELVSMGFMDSAARMLDWAADLDFIKGANGDPSAAQRLFLQARNSAVANRRGFFEWGPEKVRELVRLTQAAVAPNDFVRNARLMAIHAEDTSAALMNPDQLLAAGSRSAYQNQHAFVLGEAPPFAPGGRRPDPNSRFHDIIADEFETVLRSEVGTPEFLEAISSTWSRSIEDRFMRQVIDTVIDPRLKIGERFEQGRISRGQFRQEVLASLRERIESNPELLELFQTRFDRAQQTSSGRVVLGRSDEEFQRLASLSGSVAADVQFRRDYYDVRGRLRQADPDEEIELPRAPQAPEDQVDIAGHLNSKAVSLPQQGWTITRDESAAVEGALASTNPTSRTIRINTEAIRQDYLNDLAHWRGGEGSSVVSQQKAEVFREMDVDVDEMLLWFEQHGGERAYIEFVEMHERGHAVLGHIRQGDDLLTDANKLLEIEANEFAFAAMGMPFGSRRRIYDLLHDDLIMQPRRQAMTPERVVADIDQRLGGVPSRLGEDGTSVTRISEQLDSISQTLRAVATGEGGVPQKMAQLDEALAEAGLSSDNVVGLLDQLSGDGLFNALRLDPDNPMTSITDRVHQSIQDYITSHSYAAMDDIPGGLPITDEMMEVVADYAEHLGRTMARLELDQVEDAEEFFKLLEDETIRDLAARVADDGIEGIDNDILALIDEVEGGSLDPLGQPRVEGHQVPGSPDELSVTDNAVAAINRPGSTEDMLRLADEITTGKVVPPSMARDDFYKTLLNEFESEFFSSAQSVADDLARGDYVAAEGAALYLVRRNQDGEVTALSRATAEETRNATHDTEFVETISDPEEALTLVRDNQASTFMRPITSFEREAVAAETEDIIRRIMNNIGDDVIDPEFATFAEFAPLTFDEFLQYVSATYARNDDLDEFTKLVLQEFRGNPSAEVQALAPIAERLFRGFGVDSQGQARLVTGTDHLRTMVTRFNTGEEILTQDELARMAMRPQFLPNRTYRARERQVPRDPFTEMIDNGFSNTLLPVMDWATREPLRLMYYNEGVQRMTDVVFGNRPAARAIFDTINQSDARISRLESSGPRRSRTRWSRNGYVSAKEVKQDLSDFLVNLTKADKEEGRRLAVSDPTVQRMIDDAEISPRGASTASGRWFFNELLPKMVDEVPPEVTTRTRTVNGVEETVEELESIHLYVNRVLNRVEQAEIQLHDAGMTHAVTNLVNYTDNQAVSSLFSSKHRNLFPFYWAEERFIKRVFQTAAYNPAGFQRMLLTFRGLNHSTVLEEDENGNKIFAYPLSSQTHSILLDLVRRNNPEMTDFRVPPELGQMVGQWNRVVPGNLESGLPKNPAPVFGIIGRGLASRHPEMEGVINSLIGEFSANQNRDRWELTMPPVILRTIQASDPDEVRALYADKMFAAMAFMYNAGLTPAPDASIEEHEDYVMGVYNWTQVLAWQSVLYGFTGITSPQVMVAEGSPQWEFREYISNFGFESGIEQFMADYPDTTLFSLFETETSGGAPIPATEQVHEFLSANQDLVSTYSEASGYLIPIAEYSSDFFAPAWAMQQKLGLRQIRNQANEVPDYIENVYNDFAFQAAAPEYFAMIDQFEDQIEQARELDNPQVRRDVEAAQDEWRRDFFARHPIFERELIAIDEGRLKRFDVMRQMRELNKKVEEGDERVLAMLDGNRRMELTLELVETFDQYDLNRDSLDEYSSTKLGGELYRANRQMFIEHGQALVEENPNELQSFWTRVILPQISGVTEEDARNILTGTLES